MPRISGYREQTNGNVWDSFSLRDFAQRHPGYCEVPPLFGNRNIGVVERCNLQVAGQFPSDHTFIVLSWYARSNIAEFALDKRQATAWHAWQSATVVDLMVGSRPVAQRVMSDLMGARGGVYGGLAGHPDAEYGKDDRRALAIKMFQHWRDAQIDPGRAAREPRAEWESLPPNQQTGWLAAADAMRPLYRPVVIPVRQCFGCRITSNQKAWHSLCEVMPENIAPQALVWMHLDGLQTRDVA